MCLADSKDENRTKDYVGFFAYVVRLCYSIKVKTIVICLKVNDAIHQFRTGGLDHEIRSAEQYLMDINMQRTLRRKVRQLLL